MPLKTGDPLFVPASLRDKAITAAVDLIFRDDPSKLAKAWRLGLLSVHLVDEIYCQWAKAAVHQSKSALADPYDNCVVAALKKQYAEDDFNEGRMILGQPRENAYIADLKRERDRKKRELQEARAIYVRALNEQTHKLEAVSNIFTKKEREDIIAEMPGNQLSKHRQAIVRRIMQMNKQIASTPNH